MKQIGRLILSFFIVMACLQYTYAQSVNDGKWRVFIEPYLMLPYMNGTVAVRSLPDVELRQSGSDILRNLKMQGLLYGEVYNKDWSISTDAVYMKLGRDIEPEIGVVSGDVTVSQFNWEVAGMRRFLPWLEGGVALQLNYLKAGLDVNLNVPNVGVVPVDESRSRTWVDPSFVGRAKYDFGRDNRWFVQCRANIGGFGIGSKFYWQVQPYVGYHFSKVFQLSAGYRAMGMNYEEGNDNNRLLYDMVTHGPVIRFGFNVN